ncbi:hypothetical protein [Nocardia sp. NPDC058633]
MTREFEQWFTVFGAGWEQATSIVATSFERMDQRSSSLVLMHP